MTMMKRFIEDTVHPQLIVRALRDSVNLAIKRLEELAVNPMSSGTAEDRRSTLIKCAQTAMSSKVLFHPTNPSKLQLQLVAGNKEFFSEMVVTAVQSIDQDIMPLEMIGIKKVPGGALEESRLINGVAFKKTFR